MYHPGDLEPLTVDSLAARFATGLYAIDRWSDFDEDCGEMGQAFFIRPSCEGDDGLYRPSYGGICVHLAAGGCRLPFQVRPRGCRDLQPVAGSDCLGDYSMQAAVIAWLPYERTITAAAVDAVIAMGAADINVCWAKSMHANSPATPHLVSPISPVSTPLVGDASPSVG